MEKHEIKTCSSVTKRNEINIWTCYLLWTNDNNWIGVLGSHGNSAARGESWQDGREVLSNNNVLQSWSVPFYKVEVTLFN